MEGLTDRLTLWLLRSIAIGMLLFGTSMLMAGVPVAGMLAGSAVAMEIAGIVLQIGIVFIASGAAATYLSRARGPLLPNERAATSSGERPALAGWLIALATTLVALPAWLVIQLQGFFAEWSEVVDYLSTWDIWGGANASGAGLVLMPLAAALTPPMFELAAALSFVATSALLLVSLLSRGRRFPRIYLVCVVLSAALVIASVRGASATAVAGDAVQQIIDDTSVNAEEAAQLTAILQRYTTVVGSTAPVLMWTLFGYLAWLPPLFLSQRARTTFAGHAGDDITAPVRATDIEAITSPPRFPL